MEPGIEANDPATAPTQKERVPRKKTTLRGLVDGLLEHIRDLSNRVEHYARRIGVRAPAVRHDR